MQSISIIYLCFFIFGSLFLAGSVNIRIGTAADPRAGFYPFVIAIIIVALSAFLLIQSISVKRTQKERIDVFPKGKALLRIVSMYLAMIIYTILLGIIGYLISTMLLMAVILRFLEYGKWWKIILISIISAGASYYIFEILLEIPLPKGILIF